MLAEAQRFVNSFMWARSSGSQAAPTHHLGPHRGSLRGLTAERSRLLAGGGAAKPPETQAKQMIRTRAGI